MKFSVLMSVYKNDNPIFFEKAVLSVTEEQILKPDQIVIVCDGPVSIQIDTIIDEIRNRNTDIDFTVIKKAENNGLANALNTGLAACKHELVARMDSDDISTSDRFKKQINYLKEHEDIAVLGGYIAEFNDNPSEIISVRKVGMSHKEILKMCKSRTPMNHMSVVYKKNDVLKVGGYSENFGKLEDYKLWVDMLVGRKKMANIPDVIVNVRVGNGFIERRSNKREIKDWDMLQKYLLKAKFINAFEALRNRICIRLFIYMPSRMKQILYKTILRDN